MAAAGVHDDRGQRDPFAASVSERTPLLYVEPEPIPESELADTPPPRKSSSSTDISSTSTSYKDGDWWAELSLLTRYSLPLIATYLLQYSHSVITTIAAGRLGAGELAAASVGMTTMNIVGFATIEGMATALDTLCAQAFGSGNPRAVGLHVQRMLLLMALACAPIAAVWLVSPQILRLLVRQRSLADAAGEFLRWSTVGLPGYAAFEAGKRFLQAQGSFGPAMLILVLCTPVNAALTWLLAFKLDMGLAGAALGAALTNLLRPALLLLYLLLHPAGRAATQKCWAGFARAALSTRYADWGPVVRLSVAGSAVNLGEWAAFEVVAFSTSYLSTRHLAAQTILTTASLVAWHIPFSVSVAASTRLGHLVGAGSLRAARRAALLYAGVFTAVGLADGAALWCFRDAVARLVSDDAHVRDLALQAAAAVAAFQVIDSVICGTNGVLRGLGRQAFAAWLVFAVNYLAAVPLAVWLELGSPAMGINGVWIGIGGGMVVIALVEVVYMKVIRWQDCVDDAKCREE